MTAETRTIFYLSGSPAAGTRLHLHSWHPSNKPRGLVLLAHGYAEHAGRYAALAQHFTYACYAVYAPDHWGHGKSEGRGGHVPDFGYFTDGLTATLAEMHADYPRTPIALIGHSMGGLIAADYLLRHQHLFFAAALSGPALAPATPPSRLLRRISAFLSRHLPRLGVMKLDNEGVSRASEVVAAYRADPLVYSGRMSARLGFELLCAMARVQGQAANIRLPLLVQHGSADRLTAPAASAAFVKAVGSTDKEFRLYEGLYHEIYNEPERQSVIHDLSQWLDQRLSS